MNLKKFIYAYKRDQTIGLINTFLGKIGIKYRLKNSIQKRILFLQKSLKDITKNVVQSGNYKEMKIGDIAWSEYDYCPKILGFYEEEVQKELCKINCKYIVNLGAAEGYHAIGQILSGTKQNAICFEMDAKSRELIKINSKLNKIEDKITILEKADENFLNLLKDKINLNFKDCVFLFDIEGDEFNIINKKNLEVLKKSKLIIELHKKKGSNDNSEFVEDLEKHYNLNFLTTGKRDLSNFLFLKKFIDIDRWLMASENRPDLMNWIICLPK